MRLLCRALKNGICYHDGLLCLPKDFDPRGIPKSANVHMSFVDLAEKNYADTFKAIDDHKMIITFEPVLIMAWQDSRVKVTSEVDNVTIVPVSMLDLIWRPKVTVETLTKESHRNYRNGQGIRDA